MQSLKAFQASLHSGHRTSARKTCTASGLTSRDSAAGLPPHPPRMELAPPRVSTKKPASGGTAMELPRKKLVLIIFNTSTSPSARPRSSH
ncbi:hypothetical protein PCANC_07535 [Puccinia coronata f. sp. avenae]|uniref:Uncharacterized protein n=1 Tax=Puccinia coronata f. sp. avenae TaxID=200324 RepID=A0A2N5VSJ9_9BASI|nr:hypothetical protein PCANC_07535 [Puccinia coronata f. sp. avenae]